MANINENETKPKLDMISALQIKQVSDKKNLIELKDDGWSDYSDDEDTNKIPTGSSIVKVEEKVKKYSNLKDVLADNNPNTNKGYQTSTRNKKKQGGTFYKEGYKEKKELTKPVFASNVSYNVNINNTNEAYSKKSHNNTYNDGNENVNSNNYREKTNYMGNNREYNHNQSNRGYSGKTNTQRDEKENVMKSISNVGNLVKIVEEDNKSVKAPLKNYTDADLTKYKYKSKPDEISRPTFVNSNLENKPSNFRELNHEGDLYLKKIQETNIDTHVEFSKSEKPKDHGPGKQKKRGVGNYLNENHPEEENSVKGINKQEVNISEDKHDEEKRNENNSYVDITNNDKADNAPTQEMNSLIDAENENNQEDYDNTHSYQYKNYHYENYSHSQSHSYNYNYNKYKKNKPRYTGGSNVWDIVTNQNKIETNNSQTYQQESSNSNTTQIKPKKIIRKEKTDISDKTSNEKQGSVSDKVVVTVSVIIFCLLFRM